MKSISSEALWYPRKATFVTTHFPKIITDARPAVKQASASHTSDKCDFVHGKEGGEDLLSIHQEK